MNLTEKERLEFAVLFLAIAMLGVIGMGNFSGIQETGMALMSLVAILGTAWEMYNILAGNYETRGETA